MNKMLNCSPGLAAFVFSSIACFSVSSVAVAAGAARACLGDLAIDGAGDHSHGSFMD